MVVHNIGKYNSILNSFVAELRDISIQKDSMRFRRNIERIGEVLAYELSKVLNYAPVNIETPLGNKKCYIHQNDVVICSILRAGIPLHSGILNYFDKAQNAFISAFRKMKEDHDFDIQVDYFASPSLQDQVLILCDPMLATGQSIVNVYNSLISHGIPAKVHLVSVIASKPGIEYLNDFFGDEIELWVASVDDVLNDHGYIIPGLGDAGDLAFGIKL